MANRVTQKKKTETNTKNSRARSSNVRVVEEVKLGKFVECEPLHLPQKESKRGWQIVGGGALLIGAIVGALMLMMLFPSLFDTSSVMSFGAELAALSLYMKVMLVALVVAIFVSVVAGVMLLMKKRVPVGMWCVLIFVVTVVAMCVSFRTFRWYEERLCYENYPGIYPGDSTKGSQCPSVEDGLVLLTLRNLLIWTVGLVAVCLAYCFGRRCKKRTKTVKH